MRIKILLVLFLFLTNTIAHAEPLQTQYLDNGAEVHVLKAKVAKNNVLTVVLRYDNNTGSSMRVSYYLEHVYFIDPKENKKYYVLSDQDGNGIASPRSSRSIRSDYFNPGAKMIVWFKFPAPASDTETINLVIPQTVPFDDLPITR